MIELTIPGQPAHQGALRPYTVPMPGGRRGARVTYSNEGELKKYRKMVAESLVGKVTAVEGAVAIEALFFMRRPKTHWGTGRNAGALKDWAPEAPLGTPDLDHLIRALGDALTGIAYKDDAAIIHWDVKKLYANQAGPRTVVRIRPAKTGGV